MAATGTWTDRRELGDRLDAVTKGLSDLLAVIHRDGGQYISQHGLAKAYEDAVKIIHNLRDRLDASESRCEHQSGLLCLKCGAVKAVGGE